ncbi:MAG: HipA domain-containing protein, partial [Xanthomonadales bacterium]|nr:HipA domain-containing protein [Xanthomonadales bacterium]
MTFNTEAFVWIWLPKENLPVVAGRLFDAGNSPQRFSFTYGRSYLERENAIALSPFELPLQSGIQETLGMSIMPSCLRDAGPDAWGRRVLESSLVKTGLNELDYLLLSGSDRIGALDFQASSKQYVARAMSHPQLHELIRAAEMVENHQTLPVELENALLRGTSVGGARPKAILEEGPNHYIAKFSSTADTYNAVKAEFIAMTLASRCGLNTASVSLKRSLHKDVILVKRFDRIDTSNGLCRRQMLSALSLLQLDEMEARYAS